MPVSMNNVSQVNNTQPIKQQPKTTDENTKSFPTKTAVVVGTGLAALAAVGIYLATKGKGAKATQKAVTETVHNTQEAVQNATNEVKAPNAPSEIKTLKEKIATLRQTIKTNYQAERKELNENSRDHLNSYVNDYMGGMPKSEKDYDKVIRHLKEDKVDGYKIDEMNTVIGNYRTHLKEKAKALAGNSEFHEIKKIRCKYDCNFDNLNEDELYVRTKLVDDVLYSKANGKTSDYLESLGLSVEDAIQMIKNPKGAKQRINALLDKACGVVDGKKPDDYGTRWRSLDNKRKWFGCARSKIQMDDLFDDMYVEAKNAKLNIETRKGRLEIIEKLQQQKAEYKQKVIELSHKTRQSAEVQELKQALAKLKELEAKEKNITSANNH